MVSILFQAIKNQNRINSSDFVDYGLALYNRACHNYDKDRLFNFMSYYTYMLQCFVDATIVANTPDSDLFES